MRYTILPFVFTLFLLGTSCDDKEEELIVVDPTVGVERFLMQLVPYFSNPYIGKVSENNLVTYHGYVMPNYSETTDVFVTVTASRDITLSYEGEIKELGSEFQIDELFKSTFFDLGFFSEEPGTIDLTLDFRNSLDSKYQVKHTIILE